MWTFEHKKYNYGQMHHKVTLPIICFEKLFEIFHLMYGKFKTSGFFVKIGTKSGKRG